MLDISGKKFNRLTTIKISIPATHGHCTTWECLCDCGRATFATSRDLRSNRKRSCGCLKKEGNQSQEKINKSVVKFKQTVRQKKKDYHNLGVIFTCTTCSKDFSSPWALNGHNKMAHNEKFKAKLLHTMRSDSYRKKQSVISKIRANNPEFKERRAAKLRGRTKENHEGRKQQALKMMGIGNPMTNPEYLKKALSSANRSNTVHPNKCESKLLFLLDTEYPGQWKFVGDGQLIIAGKCPDFSNINGKKALIELYGDYWHKGENPQDRIDVFAPYGYKTLILWERELKDICLAKSIIEGFVDSLL